MQLLAKFSETRGPLCFEMWTTKQLPNSSFASRPWLEQPPRPLLLTELAGLDSADTAQEC